jgi:hypothetical protein
VTRLNDTRCCDHVDSLVLLLLISTTLSQHGVEQSEEQH